MEDSIEGLKWGPKGPLTWNIRFPNGYYFDNNTKTLFLKIFSCR